jgi:hypothetical protein
MSKRRGYASAVAQDAAYLELTAYTISLGDVAFIHQHVVDAYAVQTATTADKPIRIAQALAGLFLHVERELSGRQVQRVHQILATQRPDWPTFALPDYRGALTVGDVMAYPAGEQRDEAIQAWVTSTWKACQDLRDSIAGFLSSCGITSPA